jgi:hypothetical protein
MQLIVFQTLITLVIESQQLAASMAFLSTYIMCPPYDAQFAWRMELRDFTGEGNLEVGFEGRPVGIKVGLLLFRMRIEEYSWRAEVEIGFI